MKYAWCWCIPINLGAMLIGAAILSRPEPEIGLLVIAVNALALKGSLLKFAQFMDDHK